MSDIELVVKCYRALLSQIAPLVYNGFAPPASDEDIEILKQLPIDIPNELIELYRISNGEKEVRVIYESETKSPKVLKLFPINDIKKEKKIAAGCVLGGWRFLTINEIVNYKYDASTIADWVDYEYKESFSVYPPNTINLFSFKYRIPFASNNAGSFMGIDLNPAKEGCMNQIICYGRDFEIEYVVAKSLKDFFILMIEAIERGHFFTAENCKKTKNRKKIDWFSIGKTDSDTSILKCVYPNKKIIQYHSEKLRQDEKVPPQYKQHFQDKSN
jgi:cell wall assembly regulator SMI1